MRYLTVRAVRNYANHTLTSIRIFALNVHETIDRERLLLALILLSANAGRVPNTSGEQTTMWSKIDSVGVSAAIFVHAVHSSRSIISGICRSRLGQSVRRAFGLFPGFSVLLLRSTDVRKKENPEIGHGCCIRRIKPRLHGTGRILDQTTYKVRRSAKPVVERLNGNGSFARYTRQKSIIAIVPCFGVDTLSFFAFFQSNISGTILATIR